MANQTLSQMKSVAFPLRFSSMYEFGFIFLSGGRVGRILFPQLMLFLSKRWKQSGGFGSSLHTRARWTDK